MLLLFDCGTTTGTLGFTLGFAYLFGVVLSYSLTGVYVGLVLTYA